MKHIARPPFTVTLLISTYNRPDALKAVLQSALQQTLPPDEIVIADDGSGPETRQLIEKITATSPVPISHVWHPDTGFKLCEIRNKAIAAATGDYIIQIDGDVLLERHFIADHIDVAEPGYFVCGSRVYLKPKITERAIQNGFRPYYRWMVGIDCILNGLRIGWLRHYMAKRYGQVTISRLRGCNMAFWKTDLIAVNGYDENLTNWGGEDQEIAYRLVFKGVRKKMLKMGGVIFHLYHTFAPRDAHSKHCEVIDRVKEHHLTWCDNGLDKHLTH